MIKLSNKLMSRDHEVHTYSCSPLDSLSEWHIYFRFRDNLRNQTVSTSEYQIWNTSAFQF